MLYSDLKAATCCDDGCEEHNLEYEWGSLTVGEEVSHERSSSLIYCDCVDSSADMSVTFLGEKDGVLEFDSGTDCVADIKITAASIAHMDRFMIDRCSDWSSLNSVYKSANSYLVFSRPPSVMTGSGSENGASTGSTPVMTGTDGENGDGAGWTPVATGSGDENGASAGWTPVATGSVSESSGGKDDRDGVAAAVAAGESGSNTGLIVGAVVGAVVVAMAIITALVVWSRKCRRRRTSNAPSSNSNFDAGGSSLATRTAVGVTPLGPSTPGATQVASNAAVSIDIKEDISPDGSRKVVKTTTAPDGSRKTETTTYPAAVNSVVAVPVPPSAPTMEF